MGVCLSSNTPFRKAFRGDRYPSKLLWTGPDLDSSREWTPLLLKETSAFSTLFSAFPPKASAPQPQPPCWTRRAALRFRRRPGRQEATHPPRGLSTAEGKSDSQVGNKWIFQILGKEDGAAELWFFHFYGYEPPHLPHYKNKEKKEARGCSRSREEAGPRAQGTTGPCGIGLWPPGLGVGLPRAGMGQGGVSQQSPGHPTPPLQVSGLMGYQPRSPPSLLSSRAAPAETRFKWNAPSGLRVHPLGQAVYR